MKVPLSLLMLALLIECTNKKNDPNSVDSKVKSFDSFAWRKECLSLDSLTLNGKIKGAAKKDSLFSAFGFPLARYPVAADTLLKLLNAIYDANDSVFVYRNMIFESMDEGVILRSIYFEDSTTFIKHPRIMLNNKTRPIDVQTAFPESGMLVRGEGYHWRGYIQLSVQKRELQYEQWFLIFEHERLKKMVLCNVPF